MLLKYKPINQFTKSVIGHFLIILIGGIGVGIYGAMLLSLGILYYHFNQKNVISGFLIIILIFVFADNQFNSLGFVKTLRFTSLGVILLFVSSYLLDGKDKISVFFLPFSIYALFTSIFLSPVPMEAIPRSVGFFLVAFIFIDVFRLFFYQRDNLRFFVNVFYWIIFCYYTIGLILFFTPIRDFVSVNGRFAGLMGNPNGVGLLSFLLYPFFDYCRKKKLLTTNEIKYYKVFFSIIFISVVLSGSRNALFSLLIYEITKRYAYNFSRFAIIITLVIAGYLFISNINFPQIIYSLGLENYLRVESLENASGRADIWKVVWEKIKENPWIGKGVYYDQYFVEDYRNNVLGGIYARQWNGVWNSYLSILLDVGIIGLFLYFIFIKKLFSHCQDKVLARAFLLSALFSAIVESWMAASMNIYTPLFFIYFALQSIPLRENLSAYQKKINS
ncbi:MAG: hypothetical protein CMP48_15720 [Rickettsiales bacterium]|nr:hypothetical protein [Rickettsiales bacterium]